MAISKRILIAVTLSTLTASWVPVTSAQATALVELNAVNYNAVVNDVSALQAAQTTMSELATQTDAQIAQLTSNISGATDPVSRRAMRETRARLQAQKATILEMATLQDNAAQLQQNLADAQASLAAAVTPAEQATAQAQVDALTSEMTAAANALSTKYETIKSEQETLDDVAALSNNSSTADELAAARAAALHTAATEAAAGAASSRADVMTARSDLIATMRTAGAGASGTSTRITEPRRGLTHTSSRARVGYTIDL